MVARCNNPKRKDYSRYGGRGIKVCERWLKLESFIDDMGVRPPNKSLDRIDNNKGYCKDNCRWATKYEQVRNRHNNIFVDFKGKKLLLPELAKKTGISKSTLYYRYSKGIRMPQLINDSRQKQKNKGK